MPRHSNFLLNQLCVPYQICSCFLTMIIYYIKSSIIKMRFITDTSITYLFPHNDLLLVAIIIVIHLLLSNNNWIQVSLMLEITDWRFCIRTAASSFTHCRILTQTGENSSRNNSGKRSFFIVEWFVLVEVMLF